MTNVYHIVPWFQQAVAGVKMMSAIPEKIVLQSTTKISLNARFVS